MTVLPRRPRPARARTVLLPLLALVALPLSACGDDGRTDAQLAASRSVPPTDPERAGLVWTEWGRMLATLPERVGDGYPEPPDLVGSSAVFGEAAGGVEVDLCVHSGKVNAFVRYVEESADRYVVELGQRVVRRSGPAGVDPDADPFDDVFLTVDCRGAQVDAALEVERGTEPVVTAGGDVLDALAEGGVDVLAGLPRFG